MPFLFKDDVTVSACYLCGWVKRKRPICNLQALPHRAHREIALWFAAAVCRACHCLWLCFLGLLYFQRSRLNNSALKTVLPHCNKPAFPFCNFLKVDSHDKVLENLPRILVEIFYLPSPSYSCWNKLFSIIFTFNYGFFFSFEKQFFYTSVLIALLWETSFLFWYKIQDTVYDNFVLAWLLLLFFFLTRNHQGTLTRCIKK